MWKLLNSEKFTNTTNNVPYLYTVEVKNCLPGLWGWQGQRHGVDPSLTGIPVHLCVSSQSYTCKMKYTGVILERLVQLRTISTINIITLTRTGGVGMCPSDQVFSVISWKKERLVTVTSTLLSTSRAYSVQLRRERGHIWVVLLFSKLKKLRGYVVKHINLTK